MSSAKKQDNDYEIVTDQLDDDEEKQSEEKKLSVAQKGEANAAQQKSTAPQKPAAAVEEAEQKKQAELAKKKEAEAKAAAEKKEAEARAAAEKKAQEEKKKAQEQKEIEQAARNELKHMEEKKAGLNIEVDQLDDSFLDDPAPKEEKLVVKAKQSLPEIKNTADPKIRRSRIRSLKLPRQNKRSQRNSQKPKTKLIHQPSNNRRKNLSRNLMRLKKCTRLIRRSTTTTGIITARIEVADNHNSS